MPRIIAIDYGLKRTGIAVTDPSDYRHRPDYNRIAKLITFLKDYVKKESVELILIGEPRNLDDSDTHATPLVKKIIERLAKEFPHIPIRTIDERYSSKMASRAILDMGLEKKQRRQKGP